MPQPPPYSPSRLSIPSPPIPLTTHYSPPPAWSVQLVSHTHDAVRLELRALFTIISALNSSSTLTPSHLRLLASYIASFEAFAISVLKSEEETIFPYLEQYGRLQGPVSTASRSAARGRIIRHIRDFTAEAALPSLTCSSASPPPYEASAASLSASPSASSSSNSFDPKLHKQIPPYSRLTRLLSRSIPSRRPRPAPAQPAYHATLAVSPTAEAHASDTPRARVARLARAALVLTRLVLEYFAVLESSLPPVVEGLFTHADVDASGIERHTFRTLARNQRRGEAAVLMYRACFGGEREKLWPGAAMSRVERLMFPVWKVRVGRERDTAVQTLLGLEQSGVEPRGEGGVLLDGGRSVDKGVLLDGGRWGVKDKMESVKHASSSALAMATPPKSKPRSKSKSSDVEDDEVLSLRLLRLNALGGELADVDYGDVSAEEDSDSGFDGDLLVFMDEGDESGMLAGSSPYLDDRSGTYCI